MWYESGKGQKYTVISRLTHGIELLKGVQDLCIFHLIFLRNEKRWGNFENLAFFAFFLRSYCNWNHLMLAVLKGFQVKLSCEPWNGTVAFAILKS